MNSILDFINSGFQFSEWVISLPVFVIIVILIVAGFLVGVINTLAGSGTVITYSLFIMMGLPVGVANGTIRLGVIMQTLVASTNFFTKKVLNLKRGIILGIPTVLGTIAGARIAVEIPEEVFQKVLIAVFFVMLFFIFRDPLKWVKGQVSKQKERPGIVQVFVFFLIGIYGGFIHIGVGIFLITALVLISGYDLVQANALKVFIVFLYSPFALLVFIYNNQVEAGIGLISAIGNVFGGFFASSLAVKKGAEFLRWVLIAVILLFSIKLIYEMIAW